MSVNATSERNTADPRSSAGWIACTSDQILATKTRLSDVRVKMPDTPNSQQPGQRWPVLTTSADSTIQATQRDLRRYVALRQCLLSMQGELEEEDDDLDSNESHMRHSMQDPHSFQVHVPDEASAVEPQSLVVIAYDSYVWWASAGERSSELQEEYDHDVGMLLTAADTWNESEPYARQRDIHSTAAPSTADLQMAIIAYFQRLTTSIFTTLLEISKSAASQPASEPIPILKDDFIAMGLDAWSKADREWVVEMLKVYFGCAARVQVTSIECCGVKIY